MSRRTRGRAKAGLAVTALLGAIMAVGAAPPASGQILALPTPRDFVSNLDLECFATDQGRPPIPSLVLSHLNPVLAHQPRFEVALGARTQLCTPVAKNDRIPPNSVLDFIRFVDLSCYRISAPGLNLPITLHHLNPLLTNLPRKEVRLIAAEELCLPVIKNNAVPPDEILNLVRYIDLACYRTEPPVPLNIALRLTQLNRELAHIPPATVRVLENRQLCVPVRKNDQEIPSDVLRVVQWVDLEKYDIVAPPLPAPIPLTLRHINPLLPVAGEQARLIGRPQLALPVGKNGQSPPG